MSEFFSIKKSHPPTEEIQVEPELPPVVARMVVEIRSDGTRTIARGAIEDKQNGESAALHVEAASPIALVRELSKSLLKTPVLAKEAVRGLLPQLLKRKL